MIIMKIIAIDSTCLYSNAIIRLYIDREPKTRKLLVQCKKNELTICVSARPKKSLAKLAKADNFLLAKWKKI